MCTAPPTLHRSAHITRFRAQSLIVCCPTAFRPDFRRRLPDPDLRSSRVRRRVLRRLKVRLTPRAHSTAARPAEPTPLARSRTHQPFPHSPSLPSVRRTLPSGGPFWSLRPSTRWLRPGFTPGDGPLNLPLNPPRQSVQALAVVCLRPPLSPLSPLPPRIPRPAPSSSPSSTRRPPLSALRPPQPPVRPPVSSITLTTTAVSSSLTAAAVSAAAAATASVPITASRADSCRRHPPATSPPSTRTPTCQTGCDRLRLRDELRLCCRRSLGARARMRARRLTQSEGCTRMCGRRYVHGVLCA